jgi:hypothetical protein
MMAKQYRKALATSSTATSFASKVITKTEPTGDGVHSTNCAQNMTVLLYGAGADDSTFDVKIIGWRKVIGTWVPTNIAHLAAVLSTSVGVAGGDVVATDRFADAITATTGTATLPTVTANSIATATVSILNYDKVEFDFDMILATNGNALFVMD